MGMPAKPTGMSTEANLLYQILKQLDRINKTFGGSTPTTATTSTL